MFHIHLSHILFHIQLSFTLDGGCPPRKAKKAMRWKMKNTFCLQIKDNLRIRIKNDRIQFKHTYTNLDAITDGYTNRWRALSCHNRQKILSTISIKRTEITEMITTMVPTRRPKWLCSSFFFPSPLSSDSSLKSSIKFQQVSIQSGIFNRRFWFNGGNREYDACEEHQGGQKHQRGNAKNPQNYALSKFWLTLQDIFTPWIFCNCLSF